LAASLKHEVISLTGQQPDCPARSLDDCIPLLWHFTESLSEATTAIAQAHPWLAKF
jgi:hypothetical protein